MKWLLVIPVLLVAGALSWEASRQLHLEPWNNPDDARHEQFAARALALIAIALSFAAGVLL